MVGEEMVVDALHYITINACSHHNPIFLPRNAAKHISRLCRSLVCWRLIGIFCIYGENRLQDSTKNITAYNLYCIRCLHCRVSLMGFHRPPTGILFRYTWHHRNSVVVRSNGSLRLCC